MKKLVIGVLLCLLSVISIFGEDWTINNYVDDFGDYTDEKYIRVDSWGTFYNTATPGDKLYVKVIIDNDRAGLRFLEYGMFPYRPYESKFSIIKVKYGDSKTKDIKVFIGSTGILIEEYDEFINLLSTGGEIKVFLKDDYSGYNFTINCDTFISKYNTAFGKIICE